MFIRYFSFLTVAYFAASILTGCDGFDATRNFGQLDHVYQGKMAAGESDPLSGPTPSPRALSHEVLVNINNELANSGVNHAGVILGIELYKKLKNTVQVTSSVSSGALGASEINEISEASENSAKSEDSAKSVDAVQSEDSVKGEVAATGEASVESAVTSPEATSPQVTSLETIPSEAVASEASNQSDAELKFDIELTGWLQLDDRVIEYKGLLDPSVESAGQILLVRMKTLNPEDFTEEMARRYKLTVYASCSNSCAHVFVHVQVERDEKIYAVAQYSVEKAAEGPGYSGEKKLNIESASPQSEKVLDQRGGADRKSVDQSGHIPSARHAGTRENSI